MQDYHFFMKFLKLSLFLTKYIKISKTKISKRIEAIKCKEYDFVTISINWEYTIQKKTGEIVESGQFWKNRNQKTEEGL